jgi:LruC domain-containing protein
MNSFNLLRLPLRRVIFRRLGLLLALLFTLILVISGLERQASAASSDFKNTDFVAAAPYTYNHATGGGAYDDRTIGDYDDVVEQLEGAQFACGDTITFLAAVEIEAATVDPVQAAEFDFRFLADSTGQSGAAISDILSVAVNYGTVQGGDGPSGSDAGIVDDGGSEATLVSQSLTGPLFAAGSELFATVSVSDLEPAEQVILRIDTLLVCQPNSNPTGNLQAQLDAGRVAGSGESISTGQQTIPFLRIGDIAGTGEPLLRLKKSVTSAEGVCGVDDVEELVVAQGDTVKYCYQVYNPGTATLFDLEAVDDNGTVGDSSDDFVISFSNLGDLDGEGDLPDLASGEAATGEALLTTATTGSIVNVVSASGNNGLTGGNYVLLSEIDTATVIVLERPVARNDDSQTQEDTGTTITASANDTDADGNLDPTTTTIISGPSNGTVINVGDGRFYYTPNTDYYGVDSFDYQICDTDGLCDTATVTININSVNDLPEANGDSASTELNTSVTVDVAANDSDVDGTLDWANASILSGPTNGSVVSNGDGTFTYTPDAVFQGNDSFIYQICDFDGGCDSASAVINVGPQELTWESETTFVAYEDLKNYGWSDWDYNDFVVQLDISKGLTAEGNLAALQIDYEALARGAGFNHRFIHDLPVAGGGIASLTIWDGQGQTALQDSFTFGADTNLVIFDRTRTALPPMAGYFDTNTRTSQPEIVNGYTASLTIYLNDPGANPAIILPPIPWDPYLEVLNTGEEVHLVIPGHLDNTQAVNSIKDPSSPLIGYDLPLAQSFSLGWEWSIEFNGLWKGYPNYVDYIGSGGTTNQDWYLSQNADPNWLWSPGAYAPLVQPDAAALDAESETTSRYFASPIVVDLDGDGRLEIILGNLLNGNMEVYNARQQMLSGWPRTVVGGVKAAAAVADLDDDDDLEIVVGAMDGRLYAWHHTGDAVQGWPVALDTEFRVLASPAIADLDDDQSLDIVVPLADGQLYALEADGSLKDGWPVSIGGVEDKYDSQIINSSPKIANLDGNGRPEIVVGSTDKKLYVFNWDGSLRWSYQTGDMILSSPEVADIDPSISGLEVVIGSGDSYVYYLDQAGNLLWKRSTGWTVRSSATTTDLDGDGDIEILIGSDDDRLWAWHHDGSMVSGWPQETGADLFSSPQIGDIDGDGNDDVIVGSDDAKVYAWHADGTAVDGWPKQAALSIKGTPATANLDTDAQQEVVVGDFGGQLFIWGYDGRHAGLGSHQIFLPTILK